MRSRRLRGLPPKNNVQANLNRAQRLAKRSKQAAKAAKTAAKASNTSTAIISGKSGKSITDKPPTLSKHLSLQPSKNSPNSEPPSRSSSISNALNDAEDNSKPSGIHIKAAKLHSANHIQNQQVPKDAPLTGNSVHKSQPQLAQSKGASSPALGILAGVSSIAMRLMANHDKPNVYKGPQKFRQNTKIQFAGNVLNLCDFEVGPCPSCNNIGPVLYPCDCKLGLFQSVLKAGDRIKSTRALPSHTDCYDSDSSDDTKSSDSSSDNESSDSSSDIESSDSSSYDESSDDSDDSAPIQPKKRAKLIAKKAGRKRSPPKKSPRPTKRPKIISYTRKELLASRQHSLNKFIKDRVIIANGNTLKKKQLKRGTYLVNAKGQPIGTKQSILLAAYNEWCLTAKSKKFVGDGMDGHLKSRCSHHCSRSGHRLNVCSAFKIHMANKLGRKLDGKKVWLWKDVPGFYYYKNAFLKRLN